MRVLGRDVNISSFSETARATIAAIAELGHILRASREERYFEEFLRMHDVEGYVEKERKYELRKVGLVGITQAVNTALNQVGIGLTERFCNALEEAFGMHRDWNIAHPEARLELTTDTLADILGSINQFGFITDSGRAKLNLVLQEIKDTFQQNSVLVPFVVEFLKDVKLNDFRDKIKEVLQNVIIEGDISVENKKAILGIQDTELAGLLINKFTEQKKSLSRQEIDFLKDQSSSLVRLFNYGRIDKMLREGGEEKSSIFSTLKQLSEKNTNMKEVLVKVLINHIIPDTYVADTHQFFPAESEEKEFLSSNIAILANLRKEFIKTIAQQNRAKLDNIEKLIVELVPAEDFSKYFSNPEETEYFTILKNSKNNSYLIQVASTLTNDIMYRLYAFMQLEINGYTFDDKSAIVTRLIFDFTNQIKNNTFYNSFLTLTYDMIRIPENILDGFINFRLRSLITGVNLILISLLKEQFGTDIINPSQLKELYDLISKAVFTKQATGQAGDNTLIFLYGGGRNNAQLVSTIVHELGHNLFTLMGLKFEEGWEQHSRSLEDGYKFKRSHIVPAFHEFVAHITQEFFASKLILEFEQGFINQMQVGTEIGFNKATFKYPIGVVEEHEAASGLVGVIYFALEKMDKPLDFNIFMTLMKIAIQFVKTDEFKENSTERDTKFREFLEKASRELGIDTTILGGTSEQTTRLSGPQESIFTAFIAGKVPYEVAEKVLPKNILVAGIKNIILPKIGKEISSELNAINLLEEIQHKIFDLYVADKIHYDIAEKALPSHYFQPLQLPKLTKLYRKLGISEEKQATITAMLELGHILRASLEKEYFEEFLRMHGEENAIRRAGLLGITKAVSAALNQVGVSLTERI